MSPILGITLSHKVYRDPREKLHVLGVHPVHAFNLCDVCLIPSRHVHSPVSVHSMSIPKFLAAIIGGFSPPAEQHPVIFYGLDLQGHVWPAVAGLLLSSYVYVFVEHQYMIGTLCMGMATRVASCSLVYRKVRGSARARVTNVTK